MTEKQLIDGLLSVNKFQMEFDNLFSWFMISLKRQIPYITSIDYARIDGEDKVVITSRELDAKEDEVETFPIWALVNGDEGHERYKEMERKRLEEIFKPYEEDAMPAEDAKDIERLKAKYPDLFK